MSVAKCRRLGFILSSLIFLVNAGSVHANTLCWQGPYVGAYLGDGFGNQDITTNVGAVTASSYFATPADIAAVNNAGTSNHYPNNAIAGLQIGQDWVWRQLVFGIAIDHTVLPLESSNTTTQTYPSGLGTYSIYTAMSTNWLFTLRGRLGYEANLMWPSLVYVTGGFAVTKINVNNNFTDNTALGGIGRSNTSQNQIGWTAGFGIEVATFRQATVDFEYLYIQVPSVKTTGSIFNSQGGFGIPPLSLNSPFSSSSGKFRASILKIGLNYRFDA